MPPASQPTQSRAKEWLRFALAILLPMGVSIGGYALFKRLGAADKVATNLGALFTYPALALAVWLGGFNLLGFASREKRLLVLLICLAFLFRPIVFLGLLLSGLAEKPAGIAGEAAFVLAIFVLLFGVYRKIAKSQDP